MNRGTANPGSTPEATSDGRVSVGADSVVGDRARVLQCKSSEDGDGATGRKMPLFPRKKRGQNARFLALWQLELFPFKEPKDG